MPLCISKLNGARFNSCDLPSLQISTLFNPRHGSGKLDHSDFLLARQNDTDKPHNRFWTTTLRFIVCVGR